MTSKFKVESVNILSSWEYILKFNTECSICRNKLNENSIYNDNKEEGIVLTGKCCHTFHKECINEWNKNNRKCPICIQPFIINK